MKKIVRIGRILNSLHILAVVAIPRMVVELWFSMRFVSWYCLYADTSLDLGKAYVSALTQRVEEMEAAAERTK